MDNEQLRIEETRRSNLGADYDAPYRDATVVASENRVLEPAPPPSAEQHGLFSVTAPGAETPGSGAVSDGCLSRCYAVVTAVAQFLYPVVQRSAPTLLGYFIVFAIGVLIHAARTGEFTIARRNSPEHRADGPTPEEERALGLLAAGFGAALVVGLVLRRAWRSPSDAPPPQALELDSYETAYLAGGDPLAVDAAVAALASNHHIRVNGDNLERTTQVPALANLHPVEQAVWRAVPRGSGATLPEIHAAVHLPPNLAAKPVACGLMLSERRAALGVLVPLSLCLLVPVAGAVGAIVLRLLDKSCGLLWIATAAGALVLVAVCGRPLHRSRRGHRALDELRTRHAALAAPVASGVPERAPHEWARGVGLFGAATLTGTLAGVYALMRSAQASASFDAPDFDAGVDGDGDAG